jgi:hypothetical protein
VTRWARGKNANKKKPLEATDWTEMKSTPTVKHTQQPVVNVADSSELKSSKKTQSLLKKRTLTDTGDARSAPKVSKKTDSLVATNSGRSLVEELEQPNAAVVQSNELLEARVLEEFVRKDQRREGRRLKRQQQKLHSRVGKH